LPWLYRRRTDLPIGSIPLHSGHQNY